MSQQSTPPAAMPDPAVETAMPIVWLLGPAGSGQTSVLAALTGGWRAVVRHDLEGATPTAESLAWPEEEPKLRFLLTTGLLSGVPYDPAPDIAFAGGAPGLIIATIRADDAQPGPLIEALRAARQARPDWPVLVVQTCLHALYPKDGRHVLPYPYQDERPNTAAPRAVSNALTAQRASFRPVLDGFTAFVPVDLTQPEQELPPVDYGVPAIRQAMAVLSPRVAAALAPGPDPAEHIWRRVVIPWSLAAAVVDAPPIPVIGGFPAVIVQAAMVRAIARRFDVQADTVIWANFLGLLGLGFLLRFAVTWLVWRVLKLVPFWGMAAVGAWTFAVSCGLGQAAILFCRAESEGRRPTGRALREAIRQGARAGAAQGADHGAGRGGAPY